MTPPTDVCRDAICMCMGGTADCVPPFGQSGGCSLSDDDPKPAERDDCGGTVYKVVCTHCQRATAVRPNLAAEEVERLRGIIGRLYVQRAGDAGSLRTAIRKAFGESRP